jgi:hypothetical protein
LWGNCLEDCKHKIIFPYLEFTVTIVKNLKILTFYFFYDEKVHKEFFSHVTPYQNDIAERKNRAIQEMARTMLNSKKVALYL